MKRIYVLNGFAELREYFLKVLGKITEEELSVLKSGEVLEKDGNRFYIINYEGL